MLSRAVVFCVAGGIFYIPPVYACLPAVASVGLLTLQVYALLDAARITSHMSNACGAALEHWRATPEKIETIYSSSGQKLREKVKHRSVEEREQDTANRFNALMATDLKLAKEGKIWAIDVFGDLITKPLLDKIAKVAKFSWKEKTQKNPLDKETVARILHRGIACIEAIVLLGTCEVSSPLAVIAVSVMGVYAGIASIYEYARALAESNPPRETYEPLLDDHITMIEAFSYHLLKPITDLAAYILQRDPTKRPHFLLAVKPFLATRAIVCVTAAVIAASYVAAGSMLLGSAATVVSLYAAAEFRRLHQDRMMIGLDHQNQGDIQKRLEWNNTLLNIQYQIKRVWRRQIRPLWRAA